MNNNRQSATLIDPTRKIAIAAGIFYLITHVTSIGAALLYDPILNDANFITGSGSNTQLLLGVFLEIILALAIVGTAVALFPIVRRQNEGFALGYVGLRTLEAGIIAIGTIPLLAMVTLHQMAGTAGTDPVTLITISHALVAFNKWTALVGPGFVCGANTVLMAYLMYKSNLVPRFIPVLGLVGGPLIFVFTTARMFGFTEQLPQWLAIGVIPIFAWEVTLAIWLIAKGFKPAALSSIAARPTTTETSAILGTA